MRTCWPTLFGITAVICFGVAEENEPPAFSVGMSGTMESVILPGPPLEAIPLSDPTTALVIRVVNRYPHGNAFRYDLEFYGLEPGSYNLSEFLRPENGAEPVTLPSLPIRVASTLPENQILPNALVATPPSHLGGYRLTLLIGGVLWAIVMAWILFWRRRENFEEEPQSSKALSTADQLQPLLKSAMGGTLKDGERALLERLLLDHWRKKLELDPSDPLEGLQTIRDHDEAGILVRKLEDWLHRPQPSFSDDDVSELLEPYRNEDPVGAVTN